ncbi:MAG TPA: hypothetical protein VFQ91_16470 [Bryobacteraceae bacterium]|nr:hypothetical protein [Bryobacteraceae bacterium]
MSSGKCLVLLLSITAALWADKKDAGFRPEPAESYATKQTIEGLTIAVQPFDDPEEAKSAFGKLNPYEQGVLPVLVVIKNDGKDTVKLDTMQVVYVAPKGRKVDATPAADVLYLKAGGRPKVSNSPIPTGGPRIKVAKNPLKNDVIIERAFSAKMLPPGDSAHGFFYFQTGHTRGTSLYISGIRNAQTGKELFFFEIPLD